ncbi:MAG: hypothetical protein NT027_09390 [Proteobacteria bacterium]|nr:hypothetical protein [Pseudomonadota bacterium]
MLSLMMGLSFVSCRTTSNSAGSTELKSLRDLKVIVQKAKEDQKITSQEVDSMFTACGTRCNLDEASLIRETVMNPNGWSVDSDAVVSAKNKALFGSLSTEEQSLLQTKKTFAGTDIPAEVFDVLQKARLAGAVAYDVSEADPDDANEGLWSPYPQELPVRNNMVFSYTEITPKALQDDIQNVKQEKILSQGISGGSVTYTTGDCAGRRGSIISEYDEANHTEIFARGRSCQKWANNCGILSDGTLHCLPAARRMSVNDQFSNLILTNPSLARGKRMLFNGHIEARNGVITSIAMSGRIAKKAAKNQYSFIDPLPLLKAWGFKLAPGLTTRSEHSETSSKFTIDSENFIVRGPK